MNSTNKIKFISTTGEPDPNDFKALCDGLLSHHAKNGHVRNSQKFSIFLRDQNNKTIGGVVATSLWGGMEINSLWVDESLRGQGWGAKLMKDIEKEGIKRGCTFAYTNTFTWQAPKFYQKLGYKLYGKLENFPPGNSLSYFVKKLN